MKTYQDCVNVAKRIVNHYRTLDPQNVLHAKGGVPSPPPPPKPPRTVDAVGAGVGARRSLSKRKGFESTLLTSGLGDNSSSSVVRKLLGSG